MCLRLLLLAAFSQAMSQLLSDAGGISLDTFDIALPKGQEVNWPALPLTGLDSAGYLAAQPDSTPQNNQFQELPVPVDTGRLASGSDTDLIIAAGCAPPSPQIDPPPRAKRKLLRERQNVQNECLNPMPLTGSTSGSATDNHHQNPRLYPGGVKRRIPDWFFGTRQEWKQCPPEKITLCCTGAQEGPEVRSCTAFYVFPGSSITSSSCFKGGIYCCDELVVSERVINYHNQLAIFDRDGKNCWPLFYRSE